MKIRAVFSVALLAMLLSGLPARATDPASEAFSKILNGGGEAATVLPGSKSPDGSLAVLFTARKKAVKSAAWPTLVPGAVIGQTDANDESLYVTENWVVSLADKKKLGLVTSKNPFYSAIYGDFQLNEGLLGNGFTALWGPDQEGWHFGILDYDEREGCCDIFLVNSDGTSAKITSLKKALEAEVENFIKAQLSFLKQRAKTGINPDNYAITFHPVEVVDPASSTTVSDPLTVRIGFTAEVPNAEKIPAIEGSMTVQLTRNEKGAASAKVLGVKPGRVEAPAPAPDPEPAAAGPKAEAPTNKEFSAFRKEWNAKAKAGEWKKVTKDLPAREKGRKAYVCGWVEANVLQRLMHVDSMGEGNESITLYYWRDGQLTSVFQLRTGSETRISDVAEATETYNFVDEKLVSWQRTGDSDTAVDPSDPAFQDAGKQLLKDSIKFAEPIYKAIGAD